MKHLFVVNPTAGGRDSTAQVTETVNTAMAEREDEFEVYVTRAPMDASFKIRADALHYHDLRVYACGGDGTLNECVNGAAGMRNVSVTHFPCGTGNDFIKLFDEDKSGFFDMRALIDGEIREIDLIECNGRYSVNICSVGIDARIGADVHKYSHLPFLGGPAGYIVSTVMNFVKEIGTPMRVTVGDKNFAGSMSLICACNGGHYGGSFNPMPLARPDDGILEFLIVKKVSRLRFLQLVGKYAKGRFAEMPEYITYIRGSRMEIETNDDMVINIDGEVMYAKQISFAVKPRGVRFIFPRNMVFFAERHTV